MNTIEFPFELGTDYEDWELNLEILTDRVPHYDSYLYIGSEVHTFLNNPTYRTELIYNFDVLEAVVLIFRMNPSCFKEMLGKLSRSVSEPFIEFMNGNEANHFTNNSFYVASFSIAGEQHLIYSSNYCLYTSILTSLI